MVLEIMRVLSCIYHEQNHLYSIVLYLRCKFGKPWWTSHSTAYSVGHVFRKGCLILMTSAEICKVEDSKSDRILKRRNCTVDRRTLLTIEDFSRRLSRIRRELFHRFPAGCRSKFHLRGRKYHMALFRSYILIHVLFRRICSNPWVFCKLYRFRQRGLPNSFCSSGDRRRKSYSYSHKPNVVEGGTGGWSARQVAEKEGTYLQSGCHVSRLL